MPRSWISVGRYQESLWLPWSWFWAPTKFSVVNRRTFRLPRAASKCLEMLRCRRSRKGRRAMESSTKWEACVSHAGNVLGACAMMTSVLLSTETERWRREISSLGPAPIWACAWRAKHAKQGGVSVVQPWHNTRSA
jgi:hypothetical protein